MTMHIDAHPVHGPGDRLLVLLAHNDDEFFISPLLMRELASGTHVRIAYLTHGSIYGADSEQRMAESRAVLGTLGLDADRTLFPGKLAGIFDSRLASEAERAYGAVLEAVAGTRVDRILTTAWEGGHPDHDAANVVATALARTLGCELFEFPAYNAYRLPRGLFRVMAFAGDRAGTRVTRIGLAEGFAALRRASLYRSQRRTFLGLSPGASLEFVWRRRQQLRKVPDDRDYGLRPHVGPLLYERRFGLDFAEFSTQIQPFIAAHMLGDQRERPRSGPAATRQDYDIRPLETGADALRLTATLLRQVWPGSGQFTEDYLRWLYMDNPSGQALGANAWHGDRLVGHYVLIPMEASLRGRPVKAALSLNTAVHPAHQGRGLFTRLAADAYRSASDLGVHHVIGVANANSTPGFIGRLGFTLVAPLDAKITWGLPEIAAPAEDSDWRRLWTPGSYAWRLANPNARYSVARSGGRHACLAATGEFGLRAILQMEMETEFSRLLESRLPLADRPWLKLWIGLSPRLRFPQGLSFDLPARLRRSPLNLIYRPLGGDASVPARDKLEFSLLDFDAY